jgi:hypothetical protein
MRTDSVVQVHRARAEDSMPGAPLAPLWLEGRVGASACCRRVEIEVKLLSPWRDALAMQRGETSPTDYTVVAVHAVQP